jgi:O-antigen/teichoic acid export membrane protein
MDAAAAEPALRRLGRRALSLGAANAFDYAIQFLLPVVLVRYLDADAFGQYRLLWLETGTVMAVVTQAMSGSLYYFLPRSDTEAKRLYINQTLLFLSAAGMLGAWAVSAWNPWLPDKMLDLARHDAIVPAFVMLWVVASMLDLIATAEERVAWQAKATVSLSVLRAAGLSLAAILTRELEPVLLTLLGFVAFKVALLLGYVAKHHGLRGPLMRRRTFADQLRQSAPFGFAGALYGLRMQADQWVAAALFSVGMFASFSIAAVLGPLVHLCRQSVLHAFLPSVSRRQAAGDVAGMLELNSRGNVMVAALVYPLLVFAFVFDEEIVTIVYTANYVAAAAVMRVYTVGMGALVVELATVMLLLRQGAFAMRLGVIALTLSVAVSWSAARDFGLAGAATGSVIAIYVDHAATLWRISRRTGISVGRLQDWRSLGLLLACAALAGLFAWSVTDYFFAGSGALARVFAGGALLASAYAALTVASGAGRSWLVAFGNPESGT